ncbi:uncharacterized protein [Choristoneura fumiferana]|uniref:uncharacterized protein n=1 Tax=Choristoneura fumiferana TaxID=7141 RepID=UPI003D153FF6
MYLLILTINLIQSQEIKLEDLADGPGILPFDLGDMKLTTQKHTFLQYIKLTDIEISIDSVLTQLKETKDRLNNDTYSLYETQIQFLVKKLSKASDQLRSLEPSRSKRGLIDGLGSVIKGLTGNLDYSDAIKYNNAIKSLKTNQDRVVTELNDHISLSKEWMDHHANIISQMVENQVKINETLLLLLNSNAQAETSLLKYAKFAQLLIIINDNIDSLISEIYRIEDILAFTRSRSMHHSMLSTHVLSSMLSRLRTIYNKDQVLDLELREYYSIIETGSYFIQKQIVIVFRFPIVSPYTYNLYKLPLVPNKYNQVIVPPYPFIATEGDSYVYIEAECPKVKEWYLCIEKVNHQIRTQPDCIQNLIKTQTIDDSCKQTTISLSRQTVEKLDDRTYAVTFPSPTKVRLICSREEYNTLSGSYLATIPKNCMLRTNDLTIINTEDQVEGQPLKIAKIEDNSKIQLKAQPIISLSSINLEELHEIQNRISLQSPIHLEHPPDVTIYHTTIPFYGALLSTSVILL